MEIKKTEKDENKGNAELREHENKKQSKKKKQETATIVDNIHTSTSEVAATKEEHDTKQKKTINQFYWSNKTVNDPYKK